MMKNTNLRIKNVTKTWKAQARPKPGEIEVSDYTITISGNKYDENNAVFGKFKKAEKDIGTWFKNTIWGDVKMQRGLMWPEYEKSADLLILNNCPFLHEQTIEIKTLNKTKRIDGVDTRLKSGRKQSSNILFDITLNTLNKEEVIQRAYRFLKDNDWLEVLIVKDKNEYEVYNKQ